MSNSVKKNYIYNLIYQIISFLTPLITAPYLARTLGASAIGYYSFVSSVVIYFLVIASLGTHTVGQREIAYCQNDIQKRTSVFYDIVILRFMLSLIITLIYIIFIYTNNKPLIYYTQILCLTNIAFDFSWFFRGLEEFRWIVISQIITKVATIMYILMFIKKPDDVIFYSFIPQLFCFICYIAYIPGIIKRIDINIHYVSNPLKYLKDSIVLFIPYIATTINSYFDKIMIGVYDATKLQNGYYEEATKVVSILLLIVTILGNTLMPRISALYNENKIDIIEQYMIKSYRYTLMISLPMAFGLVSVASNFVPWFFGNEFLPSIQIVTILAFTIILIGISYLTGFQYLIGTGKQNIYTIIVTIGAILNIVLNLVLIPRYYAVGAAIATVLSEFFVTFTEMLYVGKSINLVVVFSSVKMYVFASLLMFAITFTMGKVLIPSPINSFFIFLVGSLIYVLILLVFKDELLCNILDIIYNRFNINNNI